VGDTAAPAALMAADDAISRIRDDRSFSVILELSS
jgi:hypothetical protein